MTVRCITFDLDDTLWDCGSVIGAAETTFYRWLEAHCPRIAAHHDPEDLVVNRREVYSEYPELHHDLTRLRKVWIARLIEEWGYDSALREPAFMAYWEARNAVTLFDAVPDALEGLRDRYAVGAITNGNADLAYIGIDHWFDFVVTAASAGCAKPEPAIFEAALAEAGASPHAAVHVGDDPERDVRGARAVGMRAVWVNMAGRPWPGEGDRPDAEIRDLSELDAALERIVPID